MTDHNGVIDLDAVDVGEPKRFKLAGREFTLPASLPLSLAQAAKNQDLDRLVLLLASGDSDLADWLSAHLVEAHVDVIVAQYQTG